MAVTDNAYAAARSINSLIIIYTENRLRIMPSSPKGRTDTSESEFVLIPGFLSGRRDEGLSFYGMYIHLVFLYNAGVYEGRSGLYTGQRTRTIYEKKKGKKRRKRLRQIDQRSKRDFPQDILYYTYKVADRFYAYISTDRPLRYHFSYMYAGRVSKEVKKDTSICMRSKHVIRIIFYIYIIYTIRNNGRRRRIIHCILYYAGFSYCFGYFKMYGKKRNSSIRIYLLYVGICKLTSNLIN